MQVSPEEAVSYRWWRSIIYEVVADDRHLETSRFCEAVPHRSTPQRLLVVLGRVEIYGSGVSGRRVSDARERVWALRVSERLFMVVHDGPGSQETDQRGLSVPSRRVTLQRASSASVSRSSGLALKGDCTL